MNIEIGDLHRKHFNTVIKFAISGMNFNQYVNNTLALKLYGRYFLYLELERATQVYAAYMGNRLVGVLMVDMKNQPKKFSSFWRRAYVNFTNWMMKVAVKDGPAEYDKANIAMYRAYAKNVTPDGEICFLAADPSIQGKGIGTLLLNALSKDEKGKRVFLYTDDNCTYPFYEHKGFERAAEKEIWMKIGSKMVQLTCLLYSKLL